MMDFNFDLQKFVALEATENGAILVMSEGETYTHGGVIYTAQSGQAGINLDSSGKVIGLASGIVQAKVADLENSAALTLNATGGAVNFSAESNGRTITLTTLFPIELINGNFTYNGNTLNISAGSDLAIASQRDNYSLRNENHFVYDSSYNFSNYSLVSNAERVISKIILTNGEGVRELNLEQLGTVINNFAERGVTLVEGSSEALILGDYTLMATATNGNAGLNFDLNESGMTFVPNTGDGKLKVALNRNGAEIISGMLECTNGNITFGYDHAVTFEEGTSFNFAWNNYVSTITANGNATTAIALTENGITFTPGSGDGGLNLLLTKDGTPIFAGNLNITDGAINFNTDEQKFSFSEGTKISLGIGTDGTRAMDFQVVGGNASFKVAADNSGNFTITPDDSDGSLSIAMKQNGATVFQNNISVNGALVINPVTDLLTLKDGSTASFSFNNYTLTATADGDASSRISMTAGGISFMPQAGDGTLKIALGSSNGAMTAEIEVLSGGFLFGANGSLNVVAGTELQIKFSDDYIVNFKTTDAAGGSISIGEGGLTFAPNSNDGGLQLSVTKNGETRTASLDVNGSLTYKLDGSISLAEGTVVRNVFEDGNILTITANTDASGAIVFNPQTGLSITPSTPDALGIVLTTDGLDVVNISSITGTVTYSNGLVTASDGSQAHLSVYDIWESELRTSGGSASLEFTADRTVYTANEGATFVLDYLDGSVLEIQNGSFTDIYATETSDAIELVSAGSIFYSNDDEFIFTLETAGDYTLNGMKVTTTSDNVQVKLGSVVVDGITYTPLDENISLTLGDNGATASGGKVNLQMDGFESIFGFDLTDGAVSYSNGKFTIKSGAKTYLNNGNFPTAFVAQNDFTIQVTPKDNGLYAFSFPDGAADFALVSNGVTMVESSLILNGEILVNPETHEIFLTQGTNFRLGKDGRILQITALDTAGGQMNLTESGIRFAPNENDGALEFNFLLPGRKATLDVTGAFTYGGLGRMSLEDGTQATFAWEDGNKLQLNSHGSTGSISLDFNKGIGITSADENLDMSFTDASSGYTTTISSIQGTIWYNAGKVIIDENTKLTGSGSFGGQSVDVTLEAIDGYGFLQFGSSGVTYGAGTDDLRITLSRDGLASTFTIKKGEVLIGNNIFNIAVCSDISTDLQNFMPALYFQTTDPGEYTINGQTITTSAANLALTATDNQMVFRTSSDAIEYDGMTFAGSGNVTLSPAAVTLGNGVVANGFGEDNTFVLTEQGTVIADEKVFELTEPVATGISVKGAQDGFIFSRMLTQESEERLGYYNSPDIGKIFSEEFHSAGDSSYRIETDLIGLEKVSGISNGATITGGATLNDENTLSYYVLGTDTNGKFTIGEKTYTLNDDNQVGAEIRARFDGGTAYADRINNLNGVVSGDFTGGEFKINGGSSMQVFGDDNISIYANENYQEIFGLDDGASLKVLGAGTYVVNSTTLELSGTNFIVGNADGSARILYESFFENGTSGNTITGTENNDVIYNIGANAKISARGGNDTITNSNASDVYINAGDGDNTITEFLNYEIANNTIVAGSGNDYIYNKGGYSLSVASGAGNDTVRNIHGYYPTINTGEGDDSVVIEQGHYQYVDVGDGNDSIIGSFASGDWAMGGHATLIGGNGNDYIDATDTNDASILGGQGNDTILVSAITASENAMYIDGGDDDDYIQNANDNSQIYAGDGNNSIESYGSNVTITAGTGNDTVSNKVASNVLINVGDGDNVITEILDYEVANVAGKDTLINYYENSTIIAGSGNDYIYNEGGYYLSLTSGDGNDTVTNIHGYYPTINTGAGDDSVVIGKGHYQNISTGEGNDTVIGSIVSGGWAMGGHANIDAGAGNDYMDTGYTNDSKIFGGEGNDTIITTGTNSTIDGGEGANLIRLTTIEGTTRGLENIALNGKTTVEGFQTGFGEGTDTVYITGESPAVDFKAEGLTLYYDDDTEKSLTFANLHNGTKLNLYYEASLKAVSEIFIADDEWYSVTNEDLAKMNDSELRFVGATAKPNHGIDFSNITGDLNVSLLGHTYPPEVENLLINNVHSIKGGAGNTTITGSANNDTIFAGTGATTIDAKAGDDYIVLNSEEADNPALINYTPDEGNDTIIGFGANDTLKIDGEAYSVKSGNDLIVTVGDNRITLVDGANISNPNIDADKNPLVELAEVILKRTDAGYPVMAAIAFSPNETIAPEATNYAAKEDWTITSTDNLNLHAVHYTPENSNDKWVMLIHGYGNNHTAMYPYLSSYLDNGYNVLMIDQRAAGESEGEWLTMGVAESADVALWTQEIARRNANAKITLHGVSMGAATAMLAAARPEAVNITSIVEDCGYSNVMDTFGLVNDAVLHQPAEVIQALDPVSASLTGYYLHDAAPINSISSVTVPSLFISGSEDAVAPVSMLSALYEASGAAVKEQYIVDGSPHALAIVYDPAGYNNALFSFVAEADGEGVYIDNVTDSISLRGTSYNDTILTNGANVTIDAGAGENIVSLSGGSETVIFSGKTTVEGFTPGFTTGFGDGVDALYIKQSPPGVEFFESGLTFLSSTDSVTFSDIHHTAKIDLYHTQNPQVTLASAVVLAEDEWYSVTDNDLAIRNGYKQGLYFVGGTQTANHGVDFSNIAQDVNVTIDTEYELEDVHLWINNVHSIKGGAGNTSITGSTDNDTIFSGGGQTSLWGSRGDDYLAGGAGYDTFIYALGDGNDNIQNAGEGDLIFLSDISMDQILSANITSESVALNFSDGGSVNILGTGATYQLANGSRYFANHEKLEWNAL